MAFGYGATEQPGIPVQDGRTFLSKGETVKIATDLKVTRFIPTFERPVVQASLGVNVKGAALPKPNFGDSRTSAHGAIYRVGRQIDGEKFHIRKFRRFVRRWLSKNLVPLSSDSDVSFETWIENTPYSRKRKDELIEKHNRSPYRLGDKIPDDYLWCKSFIKDENYETYKASRSINSRSDEFKCLVGPIVQAISDRVFSLDWFIKKVPIEERPQKILDLLEDPGEDIFTSDYTSFEASFRKALMESCEDELLQYMVQFLPLGQQFMKLMRRAKFLCSNLLIFKYFTIKIKGKRMSGEMDTSLRMDSPT